MEDARLDDESRAAALCRHLDTAAPSLVSALDAEGFFRPLPRSVPLGIHQQFRVGHPMQAVAAGDAQPLIAAWEDALRSGAGECVVRFVDDTSARVSIYDVRLEHGVFVAVASPVEGVLDPNVGVDPDHVPERPKVCRLLKDERAAIVHVDSALPAMLRLRPEDIMGQRQLDFVHPDDAEAVVRTWVTLLSNPGDIQRLRLRHRCGDGSYLWVEMVNQNRLRDPEHGDIACDLIDITEQVAAEQALEERERELSALTEMLTRLTESLPSGVAHFDEHGGLRYSNARLFELLMVEGAAEVGELLARLEPGARDSLVEVVLGAWTTDHVEVEGQIVAAGDTGHRVCQFVVRPLDGGSAGTVLTVTDVTASARRRAHLERQATLDPLTQCPNRSAILATLDRALGDATPTHGAAILFVDLDDFKAVNDRLGHAAGDEVLRMVADRLRSTVRGGDLVGRLGGDEFVVVCSAVASESDVADLASRIRDALAVPLDVGGQRVVQNASVGVGWSDGEHSAAELLHQADLAMYRSKDRSLGT